MKRNIKKTAKTATKGNRMQSIKAQTTMHYFTSLQTLLKILWLMLAGSHPSVWCRHDTLDVATSLLK